MGDGRSMEEYRGGRATVGDDRKIRPDGTYTVREHLATIAPVPRKKGLSVGKPIPSDFSEK